jgi:hypothetical protein
MWRPVVGSACLTVDRDHSRRFVSVRIGCIESMDVFAVFGVGDLTTLVANCRRFHKSPPTEISTAKCMPAGGL